VNRGEENKLDSKHFLTPRDLVLNFILQEDKNNKGNRRVTGVNPCNPAKHTRSIAALKQKCCYGTNHI
jgi:hypothetical protein